MDSRPHQCDLDLASRFFIAVCTLRSGGVYLGRIGILLRVVTFLAQFAIVQPSNLLTIVNAPIDSLAIGGAHSLVAIVYVDWLETNIRHTLSLALYDAEGDPVLTGPKNEPLRVEMPVEIGRPAGVPRGMTFKIPLALNLTGLDLPAGMYEWKVTVGDVQNPEWNNAFMLLAAPPQPA